MLIVSPTAPPPSTDRLCTAVELGQDLGISKQRVYALTKVDGFPPPAGWRDGGRVWSLEAVREWRQQRAAEQQRREETPT